jgi:putative nucleotidyltransferase with HDIG domain
MGMPSKLPAFDSKHTLRVTPVSIDTRMLPTLPHVAWKVLEMTTDMYCGAHHLEEVISKDQALTSRLLRIANSAFFGLRREVRTVRHAAVVLGNARVRSLVVAASLGGIVNQTPYGRSLWEHALAVGLTTVELAQRFKLFDSDDALVAGILHDIGKTVFDTQHSDRFIEVMNSLSGLDTTSVEAERTLLGIDHAEAGYILAEAWNLPESMAESIRYHHDPERAEKTPVLVALVNLADGIARKLGIGPIKRPDMHLQELPSVPLLPLSAEEADNLSQEILVKFIQDKSLFHSI